MRQVAVIILQVVLSVLIAGVLIPLTVYVVPAARSSSVGTYLVLGVPVAAFCLLRIGWPRSRP